MLAWKFMNQISRYLQKIGKMGGAKSVEVRLGDKTKSEISDLMRKVRLSSRQQKEINKATKEMIDNFNRH